MLVDLWMYDVYIHTHALHLLIFFFFFKKKKKKAGVHIIIIINKMDTH
jgi:hypothetical protein